MMRSSVKKPWASRALWYFGFVVILVSQLPPAQATTYSLDGGFDFRFAEHLRPPQDPASQRLEVHLAQNAEFNHHLKATLGFSGWDEGVYASEPTRYPPSIINNDSRDLRFRDAFVQYQNSHLFVRVGNQQVVWGEAFGYFYSDIVNPKDFRDGLFGDFSNVRLQTPMVNAKLVFSDFSLQGIYIPQAYFNIMPDPGSDFSYPFKSVAPFSTIIINREKSLPLSAGSDEFGSRVSGLVGGWDFSLFYFNYLDRSPYYTVNTAETSPPNTLTLDEHHSRVQSYGLTVTKDLYSWVLRSEALMTETRQLPAFLNGTLLNSSSPNIVYVVELDAPTFQKLNVGLQFSEDILTENISGLFRPWRQSLASIHIQRSLFHNHSLEALFTHSVADSGNHFQFEYIAPITGQLESRFGCDVYGGPFISEFGRISGATRGYVLLKYFFKG